MVDMANRNNLPGKLPVLFFTIVVLAGFRPGYAEEQNIEQLSLAAIQGDTTAQYNLGVMYASGEGVRRDEREAAKWFRMAAEQGLARAQFNLGLAYDYGDGVPEDDREAVKWYRKAAAEQGRSAGG